MADQDRVLKLENALRRIIALGTIHNRPRDTPPIPAALDNWKQCVDIAKEALSDSPVHSKKGD